MRLIAFDDEDLAVLSANLQDAVLKVGDMTYLPDSKRFAAVLSRFDWGEAMRHGKRLRRRGIRRQSGLRFERVLSAKVQGFDLAAKDKVLNLLAILFEAGEAPGGAVTLLMSEGAAIRLTVECIEAELKDLGAAWETRHIPRHPDDDPKSDG